MKTIIVILLRIALLLALQYLHAQEPLDVALEYVRAHRSDWNLQPRDLDGMTVNLLYVDTATGITRVYFLQRHHGIPVYNAILNVSISKAGKVFFAGNRFVSDLARKANATTPVLSAAEAVVKLAAYLGLPAETPRLQKQTGESHFVFEKGSIAGEEITAMLSYQPHKGGVRLAWDILLSPAGTHDRWSTRVDAVDGAVLNEYNWTDYCGRGEAPCEKWPVIEEGFTASGRPSSTPPPARLLKETGDAEEAFALDHQQFTPTTNFLSPSEEGPGEGSYRVWPAPYADPNHGPRTLVTNPPDPFASPYGWHDINGIAGAEYTITRGNNAHVYQDRDNTGYSSDDEPDGGPNLVFDPPFDPTLEPDKNIDAAAVNLFYWLNYLHDFTYHLGFDETSGNFQKNNYGKGGQGGDFIYGVVQDGANTGLSNNAEYLHHPEGQTSTIFMFIYNLQRRFLTALEPAAVAGKYNTYIAGAGWGAGAYISTTPVTGEVVLVDDGVEKPLTSDGCETILNASELAGKIALFDRGGCPFNFKAARAQEAGAIGVVICSNEEGSGSSTLAAGAEGPNVNIPVVMITPRGSETLRQYAGKGLKVTFVDPGQGGPLVLDSDLQNDVIAHEYGHGVSKRLVGGSNVVCLSSDESMSEGWSDFLALVTTVQPGDSGAMRKGVSTYVERELSTDNGNRRYPYSTDMNVNPLTYGYVAMNQEEHKVGEVWAATLWDLYWALVDKYGWKSDFRDASSGNYKAIRLVFEGLKNTPCDPGFVDGRNAILAADEALYGGENTCLLWQVFARRGLGYNADQGSPFSAGDQKEAFDLPPVCKNTMFIQKSVTPFIQPGDDIEVAIKVVNYKSGTATNVVVTDEIPAETNFKANSASLPADLQGSKVSFHLGNLSFGQEVTISYKLESSPDAWSLRKFLDDVPGQNDTNWIAYTMSGSAANVWAVTDSLPGHSGSFSWQSEEIPNPGRQVLELDPAVYAFHVEGERPALRFYHRYQTRPGVNGGIVEVREVGTTAWEQAGSQMARNGYPGLLSFRTFAASRLPAFSGNSDSTFQATYVDLDKWAGKDIQIRFRFGTDTIADGGHGWLIDDVEFMDLLAYEGEACVTNDEGDYICALAAEAGSIVDSRPGTTGNTELPPPAALSVKIYPNPVRDKLTVAPQGTAVQELDIRLLTADGALIQSLRVSDTGPVTLDTGTLPAGLYFVKISSQHAEVVEKVVIQK